MSSGSRGLHSIALSMRAFSIFSFTCSLCNRTVFAFSPSACASSTNLSTASFFSSILSVLRTDFRKTSKAWLRSNKVALPEVTAFADVLGAFDAVALSTEDADVFAIALPGSCSNDFESSSIEVVLPVREPLFLMKGSCEAALRCLSEVTSIPISLSRCSTCERRSRTVVSKVLKAMLAPDDEPTGCEMLGRLPSLRFPFCQ
mmetsp:Transcript_103717/g.163779  ORF Transcript_103717/g.163779 Transcript_103717/m.163779 type:complete len:202 (-) Transcript_103717:116-721(-)